MIHSTGGESEENRIGKGFTQEMTRLVACFEGWISTQSKKGRSDKRNSIAKAQRL